MPEPSFAPMLRNPDTGRVLGQIRLRIDNLEDGFAFTEQQELRAGAIVGAHEGYATLRAAITEVAQHTSGDTPAAAIIERGGRFYAHALRGRDLERGLHSRATPVYLEADQMAAPLALRATLRHERLRALVDGTFVHRFRD